MASFNKVILIGNLVADPELKQTQSGISVTSFRIAVGRRYTSKVAEGTQQTDFINIVAWRQTADFICNYFKKGQMIAIEGSIQTRPYEDKNGNKRTAFEVVANNVSFCGDNKRDGAAADSSEVASFSNAGADDFTEFSGDDDLPF